MRGRHMALETDETEGGNTPAYAGKTIQRPESEAGDEKHPRVCGEDTSLRLYPENGVKHPRVCGEDQFHR